MGVGGASPKWECFPKSLYLVLRPALCSSYAQIRCLLEWGGGGGVGGKGHGRGGEWEWEGGELRNLFSHFYMYCTYLLVPFL